jgi:RNA polymerase sigma factor (sigma-70 family)
MGPMSARRERFDALYLETRVALLGYLTRRCQNPDDAADLLAEVFLVAWRRLDRVPAGDEGRLWLYGVARRVLANHRRRSRTQAGLAIELGQALRQMSNQAQEDEPDARVTLLAEALAGLGEKDRELLTLTAWEDLSPAQVAVVLGQPAGVVRVRLHRARRRLRARLEQPEPASSITMAPVGAPSP